MIRTAISPRLAIRIFTGALYFGEGSGFEGSGFGVWFGVRGSGLGSGFRVGCGVLGWVGVRGWVRSSTLGSEFEVGSGCKDPTSGAKIKEVKCGACSYDDN